VLDDIHLEPEALEFVQEAAAPPYPFQLAPERGREVLDELQSGPAGGPPAEVEDLLVPGGPTGGVRVRILRPAGSAGLLLPAVVYLHGAGWVFGSHRTHDRLVREIAAGSGAAVVFPEYSLSPEARYPTALEECHAVARWVVAHGAEHALDPTRVAVAGDSVGGNLATAVAMLAAERGGPPLRYQVLFYPVTDADFDTGSYQRFATGYHLRRDAMQWYWDQYAPDPADRLEPTAAPLRASLELLAELPAALVVTAEADVLRDEGEAYANRLRDAGVPVTAVRFQGTIHDFVMLNALAGTAAARGALALATHVLRDALAAPHPPPG
jgi:acetyl esterase